MRSFEIGERKILGIVGRLTDEPGRQLIQKLLAALVQLVKQPIGPLQRVVQEGLGHYFF